LRSQEIDPLSNKKGIDGNRWQAVANVLFTMELRTQPVATRGNGFGLFSPLPRASDLPLIATGCNHGAP